MKVPKSANSIPPLGAICSSIYHLASRLPNMFSSLYSVMPEMFEDIHGVEIVVGDLLIRGTTMEEHDARLAKVLKRAQQRNFKLNKDKS